MFCVNLFAKYTVRHTTKHLRKIREIVCANSGQAVGRRQSTLQFLSSFRILDMCETMCEYSHMATNLSIDPELLNKALQVSGEKTKKAAVTQALVEFIAKRERARVKELFGQLEWDVDYDYKQERSR